ACFFTMDPNTANYNLILSEENREATYVDKKQPVCGRCYWEVEWSGVVSIAVSYKGISRKGQGKDRIIGVYVDHVAGILSFYRVFANTDALLLTVQIAFTQPLYPG
ncbi:hypothetical protein M9458_008519, partial [Cirrhinus mrigala]